MEYRTNLVDEGRELYWDLKQGGMLSELVTITGKVSLAFYFWTLAKNGRRRFSLRLRGLPGPLPQQILLFIAAINILPQVRLLTIPSLPVEILGAIVDWALTAGESAEELLSCFHGQLAIEIGGEWRERTAVYRAIENRLDSDWSNS